MNEPPALPGRFASPEDFYAAVERWVAQAKQGGCTSLRLFVVDTKLLDDPASQAERQPPALVPAAGPAPDAPAAHPTGCRRFKPGTNYAKALAYLAARGGPCRSGAIAASLGLPATHISSTLRELRQAGLIDKCGHGLYDLRKESRANLNP